MLNLYEHVLNSVISELKQYMPKDVTTVTDTDVNAEQPDYPYIAVNIINQETRVGGSPNSSTGTIPFQILSVSDNKMKALDLGHWVRHVLFMRQPLHDLLKHHIVPMTNVQPVNFNRSFISTHFEFISGGTFEFAVYDPIHDDTQSGDIEHITGNMNDSDIHADKTD